ncbi:MAG: hypothetical protein HQL21_03380 [Candidatus Omnitrophica bacterium]|nr:hypothetical protein [Candidatus Omnitrophota bacterium]
MKQRRSIFLVAVMILWPTLSWGRAVIPFSGTVDLKAATVDLLFGSEGGTSVAFNAARVTPQKYHMVCGLSHVKTPLCDVATVLTGDLEFVGTGPDKMGLVGEISSQYTLLDYKPIRDLYLKFSIEDRKLVVDSFWIGAFSGHGAVDLVGDRRMDVAFEVLSLDLEDMMALIHPQVKTKPLAFTGVVTGELKMRGAFSRPEVSGRLVAYNGRFKVLDYDSIVLNIDGTYPLLRLPEVIITSAEGLSFRVKGAVDLSDLAHLDRQVRLFQRVPIVASSGGRSEWVFKRLTSDGASKTEMKYFLMKDDRGDASAVVGVQKSIGF